MKCHQEHTRRANKVSNKPITNQTQDTAMCYYTRKHGGLTTLFFYEYNTTTRCITYRGPEGYAVLPELSNRPIFVSDTPTQFDVIPGDKWLVSCLGVLHLSKGLFYRVVPADQGFGNYNGNDVGGVDNESLDSPKRDYCGVFRFRLWWCGTWVEVLVDDRLPAVHGRLAFVQSRHSEQFWPALLEKAYAKLHGSYEALKYGTLLDGLSDLTGGITENIAIRQDPTGCGRALATLLDMTSLITCTVSNSQQQIRNSAEKLANGIQIGINYRLYAIERVETFSGEAVQLVKLRNPLGPGGEYVGAWARGGLEWDEVPPVERDRLIVRNMADGEFWISYSDFVKTFTHLEVVHLDAETSRDEPSFHSKQTWQMKLYQSSWRRGVTAGGCRNNQETFHINPQLHLILSEMDEVVVSLNQHSIMEPKVIGFTAYALPKNSAESINKQFFKKNKSLINSQYTNSRQVSHRCQLDQGCYLLIPTTFEPIQETSFTLRVYSSKPLKLKLLDTPPTLLKAAIIKAPPLEGKGFSQYESVFLQLADEHRTVNAFELQELLEACLPNDYIKSCACMDVCRQVILTMDHTGSGRLKFNDFKDMMCSLKYWQAAFKNHTKEKTGILKAERLRDALLEVGFQLNTDVFSLVISRYMRKDGTLRFGDFVSAILHLNDAFAIFESKDPLQNGAIKLSLVEWLRSSLMC
ncbi:PREDICTED: calpain-C [Ceratosolen solmsi marchali]|uniref:Calpain-C n=1 Tax=Ceratosolen solmsi marchali TaxID=326594 RepID=A0AAJ6VM58_9HYME|nr:PREDICTED: calpain-C [Ceratosolen solmsi marchali]